MGEIDAAPAPPGDHQGEECLSRLPRSCAAPRKNRLQRGGGALALPLADEQGQRLLLERQHAGLLRGVALCHRDSWAPVRILAAPRLFCAWRGESVGERRLSPQKVDQKVEKKASTTHGSGEQGRR